MSLAAHVSMLKQKHLKLNGMVEDEAQRPAPDFTVIQNLKKQKLMIKQELGRIHITDENQHSSGGY